MIDLYSLGTPNGQKISVALEEMGLAYRTHRIDLMKGDQLQDSFAKINPNRKIPAIVDQDGPGGEPLTIFESGAILIYLAEKSGQFLSTDPRLRSETLQWLFFQVGGVGPMFGQFGFFSVYVKDRCDHPFPKQRYAAETKRLLGVLEERLSGRAFLVADAYSIADMATVPWVRALSVFYKADAELDLASFPHVMAWVERVLSRPLTAKGMAVLPG